MFYRIIVLLAVFLSVQLVYGQESSPSEDSEQAISEELEQRMSIERLEEILLALDPDAQSDNSRFLITVEDVEVLVIADISNDRMRVMTPIRGHEGISASEMTRMMQANFDSALDARYAIAQELLWAVFIHPLSPLEKNQLISGVGQVVNLSLTYGSAYSGGALSFGGGDSEGINRRLIEELLQRGEAI